MMQRCFVLFPGVLAVLLAPVGGIAAGQGVLLSSKSNAAIDVAAELGWSQSVEAKSNAAKLNAAMADASKWMAYIFPAGRWELTQTISTPARWGYSFIGAGGLAKDLGENHYSGSSGTLGGPVTRFVWRGNGTDPMMRLNSGGSVVSGIMFQGRPVAGAGPEPASETVARVKIGLHINTSSGGATNGAKCRLDRLGFYQCETDILIGTGLTGGEADDHADSIYATDLHFYHPHGGPNNNTGSCVHIRNDQSVANSFQTLYCSGNPAQVFYQERGGKTHVGLISLAGSPGGTTACIRVGRIDVNQSPLIVDQVAIDASSSQATLLAMDGDPTRGGEMFHSPVIEIRSAIIPPNNTAPIQVDAKPGAKIVLRNVWGLKPGTIKLRGWASGTSADKYRSVEVALENCVLVGVDWPGNKDDARQNGLINSGSRGPYILRWKNCTLYQQNFGGENNRFGQPFADGEQIDSAGMNFGVITQP